MINTSSEPFFKMLLDPKNNEGIGVLCSKIVEQVYKLLSVATEQSQESFGFHSNIFKYISETNCNSLEEVFNRVDKVFKFQIQITKVEKVVLFNLLTHIFLEEYVPQVIKTYRNKGIALPNINCNQFLKWRETLKI